MERITPKEKRERSEAFGVAIFILTEDNRVFTLQEMETDRITGKAPGKYGVICEKRADGNESWAANMMRAIIEETRIEKDSEINRVIDFPSPFPEKIFEMPFTEKSWATVIVLRTQNPELFMELVNKYKLPEGNGAKNEVRPIGFLSRQEFEQLELRRGVRNIMKAYGDDIFNHKK